MADVVMAVLAARRGFPHSFPGYRTGAGSCPLGSGRPVSAEETTGDQQIIQGAIVHEA
jgi:hypothetical protein